MRIDRNRRKARKGVAVVEMAFVSSILFLFLFGIFEYCRLLFVIHVATNAARDAARFAVVRTSGGTMPGEPATINESDVVTVANTGMFGTVRYGSGMCGMQHNIDGYNVEVFYVDPAGLSQTPPVVQPITGYDWTDTPFTQRIAVRITGNYRPVLPNFLMMNTTIPLQITSMVSSEAN